MHRPPKSAGLRRGGERGGYWFDLLAVLHDDEVARRLGVEVAELHNVRVAKEVHEAGLVQRVGGGGRPVLVAEARDLLCYVVPAVGTARDEVCLSSASSTELTDDAVGLWISMRDREAVTS